MRAGEEAGGGGGEEEGRRNGNRSLSGAVDAMGMGLCRHRLSVSSRFSIWGATCSTPS